MRTRRFTFRAVLGTAAASVLLATGLVGCGDAPPDESEDVETRSDALEHCETNYIYHVEPDGESGSECQITYCTRDNGCNWSRVICSDGTDETNESQCWNDVDIGCDDDYDCAAYLDHNNDFGDVWYP